MAQGQLIRHSFVRGIYERIKCRLPLELVFGLALLAVVACIPSIALGKSIWLDSTAGLQVNPVRLLVSYAYVWNGKYELGMNTGWSLTYSFPIASFYAILFECGFPMWVIERIWMFILLFGSGTGAMLLARSIVLESKRTALAPLLAGLTYMLSPFTFVYFQSSSAILLTYATLPFLLYFMRRQLTGGFNYHTFLKQILVVVLASFIQPPYVVVDFSIVGLYVAFYAAVNWKGARQAWAVIRPFFALVGATFMINLWWILPTIIYLGNYGVGPYISTENPLSLDTHSSYLEILRELGNSGFYGMYAGGGYYFPYAELYMTSPMIIAVSITLPIVCISALLIPLSSLSARVRHDLVFFGLLSVISIPLASGAYPPYNPTIFGDLYLAAFRYLPGGFILKQSIMFVMLLSISYSVMVCVALTYSHLAVDFCCKYFRIGLRRSDIGRRPHSHLVSRSLRFRSWVEVVFSLAVVVIVLVDGFPIVTGQVVDQNERFTSIPEYWDQAASWVDNVSGNFRVLATPYQYFPVYDWGARNGPLEPTLFTKPVIVADAGALAGNSQGQSLAESAYALLADNRTAYLPNVLSLMNTRYVLQQDDLNLSVYNSPTPAYMSQVLNQSLDVGPSFGKLHFYQNPIWQQSGIYSPREVLDVNGGVGAILSRIAPETLTQESSVSFNWLQDMAYYGVTYRDFAAFTNVTITSGNYAAINWFNGSNYISAQLRSDDSQIEMTGGDTLGLTSGSQAVVGKTYSLEFLHRSDSFTFLVDGTQVARATANMSGPGYLGLATYNSVASFSNFSILDLSGNLPAYSIDFSTLPYGAFLQPGWHSQGGQWMSLPTVFSPSILTQSDYVTFSWLQDMAYYNQSYNDFAVFANVTITSGNYAAINWFNGTSFISAQLRSDNSQIEITGGVTLGSTSGFRAIVGKTYSLEFTHRNSSFEFYVDGAQVAQAETNVSGPGYLGLATYNSAASFSNFSIHGLGASPSPYSVNLSNLGFGPFSQQGWQVLGGNWSAVPLPYHPRSVYLTPPYTAYVNCLNNSNDALGVLCSKPQYLGNFLGLAHLNVTQTNPVLYRITVTNVTGPFMLVFSSTFDVSWELRSGGSTFAPFLANAYAMGWWVTGAKNGSVLTLSYEDQASLTVGVLVSITSVTLLIFAPYIVQYIPIRGRRFVHGEGKVRR